MKKGFTLIELLAVIVILAIIAIIATPIIINIIEDSRKQATLNSAQLYVDGLIKQIASKNMVNEFNPSSCTIANSNVTCDGVALDYQINGKSPVSGSITLDNGKVSNYLLAFDDYKVTKNNSGISVNSLNAKPCSVTDGSSSITSGVAITCGTEKFHVIGADSNSAKLLADENITLSTTNPVQTSTFTPTYFSDTAYWYDTQNDTANTDYAVDSGHIIHIYHSYSNLYQYINAYETTLTNLGVTVTSTDLIDKNDINIQSTSAESAKILVKDVSDVSGNAALTNVGIETINTIFLAIGANSLNDYSNLTDLEKAKLYVLLMSEVEAEGLSNATDEEKIAFAQSLITAINSTSFIPYWMYDGYYYWSSFASGTGVCYPWKENYDCGANYNNNSDYSIRPVIIIPINNIEY